MYDDRPLVDLINSRFDDMTDKISDLKRDMLRETQRLTEKYDQHEEHDAERFTSVNARFSKLDKAYWMISGGVVVLSLVIKIAERFIF